MISRLHGVISRRVPLVLGAMVMASAVCLIGTPKAYADPGDLNGDAMVDLSDAVIALEITAGITESDPFTAIDGDVAGGPENSPDGKVSLLDAVRIARAANGLDDLGGGPGPGAQPAVLPTTDNVTFAANFVKNYKLPAAYKVQGTVTDSKGQSISSMVVTPTSMKIMTGTISFQHATNYMAYGSDSPESDMTAFTIFTDKGTNNVTIDTSVTEFNLSNGSQSTYSVVQNAIPSTLNVTGDMTGVKFTRPDLPAPGTVKGNITGSNFTPRSVSFALDQGAYSQATLNGSAYSVLSGPGTGTATINGHLTADEKVNVSANLNNTPITVTAGGTTTKDFTIPTLATITGTITPPAGLKVTTAFSGEFSVNSNYYTSNYSVDAAAQTYKLAMPPGTYPLQFSLPQTSFPTSSLTLYYRVSATLNAGANTKNVTLPAVPSNVTFSGTITGPDNKPLPEVFVSVSGTHASGYSVSAYGETNAAGVFTITLPAGSYNVYVSP